MVRVYEASKDHSNQLRMPDYTDYDFTDLNQFKQAMRRIPVNIGNAANRDRYVSESSYPFLRKNIMVFCLYQHLKPVLHTHDFFEIIYVIEGECVRITKEDSRVLRAGDFVISPSNTPHDVYSDNGLAVGFSVRKSTFESTFFSMLQGDDILGRFFRECLLNNAHSALFFSLPPTAYVLKLLQQLFLENDSDRPYTEQIKRCYLEILLYEVIRAPQTLSPVEQASKTDMFQVLTYIRDHSKQLTMTELSNHFGYEPTYLGKKIHRATGMFFNDIVNHYRVQHAITLLRSSEYTVAMISGMVGFHSSDHFSRTFKKLVGMTPSSFRTQQRSEN